MLNYNILITHTHTQIPFTNSSLRARYFTYSVYMVTPHCKAGIQSIFTSFQVRTERLGEDAGLAQSDLKVLIIPFSSVY